MGPLGLITLINGLVVYPNMPSPFRSSLVLKVGAREIYGE